MRDAGLAAARPGHLGGARRAAALCVVQADELGRARPCGQARGDPRRRRATAALGGDGGGDPRRHPRARSRPPRRAAPALRDGLARRLDAAGGDLRVPARRRRAAAPERARDPGGAHRRRLRPPLQDRGDRRRAVRQGGHIPHLLVLARLGARGRRRAPARARPDGAPAARGVSARALRRGVRRADGAAPRQLPAGLLAPRTDRGGRADHHRGALGGGLVVTGYDVIVIGSGAGGGTLVHRLAPSGKRILLLERGDWLRREPQNWSAHSVFVDNRYVSADTWYDADDKPFQPQVHYFVGGATKLYGAALYRLRAEDFGELMHHDGPSPAWPVGYDEFEPYYTQAETLYRVHGARGED